MTFSSYVFIHAPVDDRHALFRHGQNALTAWDQLHREPDRQHSEDHARHFDDGTRALENRGMQGLPGRLSLYYHPERPIREDGQGGDSGWEDYPDCHVMMELDAGYGSGEIHAAVIANIGQWLDERRLPWSWTCNGGAPVHTGYAELNTIVMHDIAATNWLTGTVLPAAIQQIRDHAPAEKQDVSDTELNAAKRIAEGYPAAGRGNPKNPHSHTSPSHRDESRAKPPRQQTNPER